MSSKLNLLLSLNAYEDAAPSNNPSMNVLRWDKAVQGIDIKEPNSRKLILGSEQVFELFSGNVQSQADGTTTWDLSLKSGTSNTYIVSHNAGTAPEFRVPRTTNAYMTTEVSVTKNGKVLTFTSTGGQAFDLISGGVVVGDEVRVGSSFNAVNQGKYKIISVTTTSFSVSSEIGSPETIVLGPSFDEQIIIHSASGVQIGDKIELLNGFSPVSLGTYEITDVASDWIQFFSLEALPSETNRVNSPLAINIYREAKKFLYIESDQKVKITIDQSNTSQIIEPMFAGKDKLGGFFLYTGTMRSVVIENVSKNTANVYYVTAE